MRKGDAGPAYRPTAFPTPDDQSSGQYGGQYSGQYGGQYSGDGTYTTTTTTNGGFGFNDGPQPSYQGGYPGNGYGGSDGPIQVFGPGGQQINSGFSSSFSRPVDTTVEEQ